MNRECCRPLGIVGLIGIVLALSACAGSQGPGAGVQAPRPQGSVIVENDLPSFEEMLLEQQIAGLDAIGKDQPAAEPDPPPAMGPMKHGTHRPEPGGSDAGDDAEDPAVAPEPAEGQAPPEAVASASAQPEETPEDRLRRAADALARAMSTRALEDPFGASLTQSALGALLGIQTGPSPMVLTPDEAQSVEAVRAVLETFASNQPDAGSAADRLEQIAAELASDEPIRIQTLELCSRVEAFGRYQPINTDRIRAGKPQRVIVYVELDRFGLRQARPTDPRWMEGDTWAIEVVQELSLSADGVVQWRHRPMGEIATSRNRLRDFYLVQLVELPGNLSIGTYELKVTVRDAVTDAVAQAVTQINVVADPKVETDRVSSAWVDELGRRSIEPGGRAEPPAGWMGR